MGDSFDIIGDFPQSVTVTRSTAPQTLNAAGIWVDGSTQTFEVILSLQPFSGREMLYLPEGERNRNYVKAYCPLSLGTSTQSPLQLGDSVAYLGVQYVVTEVQHWVGDMTHWKAIMAEVNP